MVRAENILLRLEHIPSTLKSARINLDQSIRPFATAAIETLEGIDVRLLAVQAALQDAFPAELGERLAVSTKAAIKALENYREWLRLGLDTMQTAFAIGPHAYQWFLTHVALIPYTPGQLLAQGRQAWNRSVSWDVIQKNRNRDLHEMPLFKSARRQVQASSLKENEIRAFLESSELMTVPGWLQHYRNREIPDYLEPLSFMGVNDDLTSENRLDEDAYSYIPDPAEDLSYFRLASARDPRPLIIHEGIPGHYFQLGDVRERAGDLGGALAAFEAAKRLASLLDMEPVRDALVIERRIEALRRELTPQDNGH